MPNWEIYLIVAWAVIGVFGLGTWYELEKPIYEDDWIPAVMVAIFWPVILGFVAVVAVGWCLSWIPRGPARLALWLLRRNDRADLPEARVVE